MKTRLLVAFLAVFIATQPLSVFAKGSHATKSYTKKDGTHVASSRATNPDKTKRNNYSSKGNSNPSSGKEGTKSPDK